MHAYVWLDGWWCEGYIEKSFSGMISPSKVLPKGLMCYDWMQQMDASQLLPMGGYGLKSHSCMGDITVGWNTTIGSNQLWCNNHAQWHHSIQQQMLVEKINMTYNSTNNKYINEIVPVSNHLWRLETFSKCNEQLSPVPPLWAPSHH